MRHALRTRYALAAALLLMGGTLTGILAACGGYGGGSNYGSGGGGISCGGGYANSCPAPSINLTAPAAGATVSGTVTLTANASASQAYGLTVTSVEFKIDGTSVGTATTSPYTVMWNSAAVDNGSHSLTAQVTDNAGGVTVTPAVNINVQNMAGGNAAMGAAQIYPAPASGASGMADLSVKLATGAARGTVKLAGLIATSVTLNEGFAGTNGPIVLRLVPGSEQADEWLVPADALLTAEQITALQQGRVYVIAASAAYPHGEIRGQIVPENIAVTFSAMAPVRDAQAVNPAAAGVVAATVDRSAHTLSVAVSSSGVEDASAAEVADAATGRTLAVLTKDSVDMGHWSAELIPLTAADVSAFEAGSWYVRVATPVETGGALGGEIAAPRH